MHDSHRLFLDTLSRFERPLLRYALSFTHDAEEARDVVQDVFLKLSQNLATLDPDRLAPWLSPSVKTVRWITSAKTSASSSWKRTL